MSGLKPYEDIDIVFTGIRAGEKLFEELKMAEEHVRKTYHPKISIVKIDAHLNGQLHQALEQLTRLSADGQVEELYNFLQGFLAEAQLVNRQPAFPREAFPSPVFSQMPESV
jgi:FlaA1/EpsC-like NDP-sugar epimerase